MKSPKYDSYENITNIDVPEYNVIKKDDAIIVTDAKRKVQHDQFDSELSVVTEQGMFGQLGLEDPNVINVENKRAKY